MVTRIDDFGKYYADLSVKAEQNKAEKEAECVRQVNEEAERQRAKRDAEYNNLQGLLEKTMQKEKSEKERLAQAKQAERIKELEKQWEKVGDYKTDETVKYENSLRGLAQSLSSKLEV